MNPSKHLEKALRIERSLGKLPPELYEIRIEAAMLAATHWLNAGLHWAGATSETDDILHTYMLSINAFRRYSVYAEAAMQHMAEIEDMRPFFVRGDAPGGEQAADRANALCCKIRDIAMQARERTVDAQTV
jgi:aromatic ring-opening dioxygenase catalytic subunit (LigB family)